MSVTVSMCNSWRRCLTGSVSSVGTITKKSPVLVVTVVSAVVLLVSVVVFVKVAVFKVVVKAIGVTVMVSLITDTLYIIPKSLNGSIATAYEDCKVLTAVANTRHYAGLKNELVGKIGPVYSPEYSTPNGLENPNDDRPKVSEKSGVMDTNGMINRDWINHP